MWPIAGPARATRSQSGHSGWHGQLESSLSAAKRCLGSPVLPDDSGICNDILRRSHSEPVCHCIGMYSSLLCAVLQTFSEFGMCYVADFSDVLCLQSLACHCVVLQTAKRYVLTGICNLKYWVSSEKRSLYVLVGIGMYCVCIDVSVTLSVCTFGGNSGMDWQV